MLSAQPKSRSIYQQQVVAIAICWTIIGMVDAVHMHGISNGLLLQRTEDYHFGQLFWSSTISAILSGAISGYVLVFYLRRWSRQRPFGLSIAVNTTVITVLNVLLTVITYQVLTGVWGEEPVLGNVSLLQTVALLGSPYFLKGVVLWVIVVLLTIIALNVNEKYGHGVLLKLLTGHYHKPQEEERVFMFVDIRSSTGIAEKLGHVQFFRLLNDFFADITEPVIRTRGEIYQYVGDEVVISWNMKKGTMHHNAIRCFFLIQEAIQKTGNRYRDRYGLVPEFKVGLHAGVVTTGEIGVIKKDIVYSGDVMNTTSRIQAVCNKFRVNILMSKYLLDQMRLPYDLYPLKRVGVIELKGKKEKVELFTFEYSILPRLETDPFAFT